jgi:hypothetical protein
MPLPRIRAPKQSRAVWQVQTNKSGSHFVSQEQAIATFLYLVRAAQVWDHGSTRCERA